MYLIWFKFLGKNSCNFVIRKKTVKKRIYLVRKKRNLATYLFNSDRIRVVQRYSVVIIVDKNVNWISISAYPQAIEITDNSILCLFNNFVLLQFSNLIDSVFICWKLKINKNQQYLITSCNHKQKMHEYSIRSVFNFFWNLNWIVVLFLVFSILQIFTLSCFYHRK